MPEHSATQQKVRDAMSPRKKQTVAQIAEATDLRPSTVGKALIALLADQCVVRIPATDARGLDRWRAATLDERRIDEFWGGTIEHLDGTRATVSTATGSKAPRKTPTPLRAEVAAYLASATEPVSAHRIGKALGGRSAGAVQNVLDRLVEVGEAVQVTAKPRSYASIS